MVVLGGVVEKRVLLGMDSVQRVAQLPSLSIVQAQLVHTLRSPAQQLKHHVAYPSVDLVRVLNQRQT